MNKRVRQSFSIRKYSVGTGSILLGVFLAFSADNVVKAEEQSSTTTEETIRAQEKDIEMTNGKLQSEEITPEKASTEEQPKEATPEEASTEEQPKEATPEEASTEEQLKEATPEEASTEEQPKEATPEKASTEEQPKEATPEEASTEEQPKEATPEEASTEEQPKEATSEEASTEEQPKEATSEEASTEEQPKEATPEEALNSSSNLKVDNINSLQSSKEKENMLLNHYTSETGLTAEEVKSNLDSLNLDYSNLDMKEIDQAILKAVSEKREKEKMLATPVSTTPANRSVEPDKLLTRNKRMANTLLAPNQALKNINITLGDLGHYDFNGNLIPSSVNDHKVYPTDGEAISINVSFNVDNSAKSGDTFTLKHSENMTTDDLPAPNEVYKPIDIVDRSGEVIATGSYDETTKETTYTFTDYVDRYENVKAVLHLEHYIDRNVVLNNTNSIPVTFTIGDTTVTENYSVTYLDPEVNGPANIQTTYTSFDPETGRLEQIGYINPKALNAYNTTIRVGRNGSNSSAVIDRNTLIEVYKVPNRDMLPGSMKIQDFSALTKINPQISYYSNNTAEFRLGNISDVYVVRVVSYIDKTKTGPASQRITMDAADNTGSYYNAYYSNMIVKNSDTADGSGNEIPKRYKIGDYVWLDTNKDGIQNEANTGVPNVLVTITYPDGSTKGVRTDANGHYEFGGLLDGEKYKINFEVPDGYKITNSNAGTDNNLDSNGTDIDVQINGADDMSLDLGLVQTVYNVGDKVWEDTNKDGIQDDNEPGIKDVTVTLTKPDGTTVTTKTDENGNYNFPDLPNGTYEITFETPAGFEPTKTNVGTDDKDSDGQKVTVVVNNKDDMTIDSGFHKSEPPVPPTYNVGDKVWEDTNKDGIQDDNEPGIKDVTVTLTKPDGTTVTTKTDENGNYNFPDLPNGTYEITFETPAGFEPTKTNVGTDDKDSDGQKVTVVVNNKDDMTIDSGFHKSEPPVPPTYNVGDKVWEDTNKDGIQDDNEPGIKDVTVTLTKPDGTTVTTKTDENGNYNFPDLPNGTYEITFETPVGFEPTKTNVGTDDKDSDGQKVTVVVNNKDDMTIDSGFHKSEPPVPPTYNVGDKVWEDTNKDGIQDDNEPGIKDVTVTLTKPDGTTVTTKTDENGNYNFPDLPNGTYEITFETPAGFEPTKTNVGTDDKDSDGQKVTVVVNNKDDMTIDSGFHKSEPPVPPTYNVGDKVWEDTNKDGIQDDNEPGIKDVTVTLTKPDGTTVTTKTDENGNYNFPDLPNGTYEITFETPAGFEPTKTNVGTDDKDSDGQKVTVVVNNKDDMTIDSGFHKSEPPVPPTYNVGDKVWEDTNKDGIQDDNEPGIKDVTVTLTKPDGTTVTTKTDENGNYNFPDLPNGTYEITFETPAGFEPTKTNVGTDDKDSDGQKVTVVVNNKDDMTIDSGFHKPVEEPTPEPPTPDTPDNPIPEPPTPDTPDNPTPEPPTPDTPDNPTPAPPTPDTPDNPMPEPPTPSTPDNPMPEPPTPGTSEEPVTSTPQISGDKMDSHKVGMTGQKVSNEQNNNSNQKLKQLPDTGINDNVNTTLIGSLLAGLGALFMFRSRRKKNESK